MTPVRQGADHAAIETALTTIAGVFADAGYAPVATGHLFEAETLIDLYGEDIRARAFLFPGTGGVAGGAAGGAGEMCLRPDFTVPVVRAHGAKDWARPARYTYQGPVFRRQEAGSGRPVEYLQAGIENLGEADAARADADVLALILAALEAAGARDWQIATGDLGVAFALLDAVPIAPRQRHQLKRHFWRPARFHTLIEDAVAGPKTPSAARARLIEAATGPDPEDAITRLAEAAGEPLGLRETEEIAARAWALAEAVGEPPMPSESAELIETALSINGPAGNALARLRALTHAAGADIGPALDRFEARLTALDRAGIDAASLSFDAAFGRNLEYYEGFVFEISSAGRSGLPPLAGGGRYDAMTRRLGAPDAVPAVGAMIRPEVVLKAQGGAS